MLYYEPKSNLLKCKCELPRVYQKANDNSYTSPPTQNEIFAQEITINVNGMSYLLFRNEYIQKYRQQS